MRLCNFTKKMRTGSLIWLLVRKCLCVSVSRGKASIYFLLNIGYTLRPSRRVPSSTFVCYFVVLNYVFSFWPQSCAAFIFPSTEC